MKNNKKKSELTSYEQSHILKLFISELFQICKTKSVK